MITSDTLRELQMYDDLKNKCAALGITVEPVRFGDYHQGIRISVHPTQPRPGYYEFTDSARALAFIRGYEQGLKDAR